MFAFIPRTAAGRPLLGIALALLLSAHVPSGQAALAINATRVVFDSDKRSVALIVSNPSRSTYAVQTWVNTASDDTTTAVPFIASPPLFRLNPGKEQQVQINGLPASLPKDRESLFYFNVQEIPQAAPTQDNVLNVALRTRIKLFYRPVELKDNPVARLKELQWSLRQVAGQPRLVVHNPTPFHVSFSRIEITAGGQRQNPRTISMVEPFAEQSYALDTPPRGSDWQVVFSAINDYGGQTPALTLPVRLAP
ncbi:molecular chaperone [Pseudomonas batumici]|uniref:fimbrial biogenesis chaperone n=1 Tax=Pseudomonas batumici TaxID=226910 RepID=UPI0030D4E7D5